MSKIAVSILISRIKKSKVTNYLFLNGVLQQRGQGFGALTRTVARYTLPLLKKYVLLAGKKIGVIESGIFAIFVVLSGQESVKKAA